jgi:hypothetical protein
LLAMGMVTVATRNHVADPDHALIVLRLRH